MLSYTFLQIVAWVVGILAVFYLLFHGGGHSWAVKKIKGTRLKAWIAIGVLLFSVGLHVVATNPYPPHFALPPYMQTKAPHGPTAALPLHNAFQFFKEFKNFERIEDIGADPNAVPPPITRDRSEVVTLSLTTREVIAEIGDGVFFNYWTFDGQVPGPMLRVRHGEFAST
jgi:hypothetical protein